MGYAPRSVALDGDNECGAVFLYVLFNKRIIGGILCIGVYRHESIYLAREAADAVDINGWSSQAARLHIVALHLGIAFVLDVLLARGTKKRHAQQAQHKKGGEGTGKGSGAMG